MKGTHLISLQEIRIKDTIRCYYLLTMGFPDGTSDKEPACQMQEI